MKAKINLMIPIKKIIQQQKLKKKVDEVHIHLKLKINYKLIQTYNYLQIIINFQHLYKINNNNHNQLIYFLQNFY